MADSFVEYAAAVRDRGTAVDAARSGDDLLARAASLRRMRLTETGGGEAYRTPGVTFTPSYDLDDLLHDHDDNVVGRVAAVSRSAGSRSGVGSRLGSVGSRFFSFWWVGLGPL